MPKFPDRWFDYTNTGDVIQGTRLITFKVPLKESFFANNKNIREDSRFTPATLLKCMNDRGLKLGLVIDLTFTNRYYDQEEFTSNGVQYKKIFVEGHVIPKKEVIDSFYEAIDSFIGTSEEDSLIGVHCTHGVNRTGYVVCRYMVEHLGMKATDALEAYGRARGYPVERVNYINDLKRRAGEEVEEEVEETANSHGGPSSQDKGNNSYNYYRSRERGYPHEGGWNEMNSHHGGGWNEMNGHHQGGWNEMNSCHRGGWNEMNGHQRVGGRNESHRNHESNSYRNYDQYYYGPDSDNWRNPQGQFWGQGAWSENQYGRNGWNGYNAHYWQQQPAQYHQYSDGPWNTRNNYGRSHPPYRSSYRGRGGYHRNQNNYDSHIQYNGCSDYNENCSYNRSYSRQTSYSGKMKQRYWK